jgi:hypothetical protein
MNFTLKTVLLKLEDLEMALEQFCAMLGDRAPAETEDMLRA